MLSSLYLVALPALIAVGNLCQAAPLESSEVQNLKRSLNPNVTDCQLIIPADALTAKGLSTPWELEAPCSQSVAGQQAFAEAVVIDSTGKISIYHPLIIDQGETPPVAPVVPNLGAGAQVALFFGFNGNTLTLADTQGRDTNTSPSLAAIKCVNGLPGTKGDVFGQVSWCNTAAFWNASNAAVASGQLQVPGLGNNNKGGACLSSRSFQIVDQDPSDNLPTKYLLLPGGKTIQFTAANRKRFPNATEMDNASDEALIGDIVGPVIGCTTFQVASLDDPGSMVPSLATQELQAAVHQQKPIAFVPLNDPDNLLTANGAMSADKTNAYRLGVNQPLLGDGPDTDNGSGTTFCNNLIAQQPVFLAQFQTELTAANTPDDTVGNNLFTFLANRFLQSLVNLKCSNTNVPVTCTLDGNGVATRCSIASGQSHNSTTATKTSRTGAIASTIATKSSRKGAMASTIATKSTRKGAIASTTGLSATPSSTTCSATTTTTITMTVTESSSFTRPPLNATISESKAAIKTSIFKHERSTTNNVKSSTIFNSIGNTTAQTRTLLAGTAVPTSQAKHPFATPDCQTDAHN